MRTILYFLGSLLLAVVVAFLLKLWLQQYNDPGYVLMGMGHWALESTLVVFVVSLVFVFFIFYFFFRLLGWALRMPGRVKDRRKNVKLNRSQEALISGLVDSAEGNWEKAESTLIKHASTSGAPLLHYLTAARAAHSRGALKKRDEYLQEAAEMSPDSEVVVGLTRAEMQLSEKQFDQALETLTRLQSLDPGHASVLKLLHQTYRNLGDWESIRQLIPSLHQNKVLMEVEVKLLEAETFSGLLKDTAHNGSAQEIKELWEESVPGHVKGMKGIPAIYFAAMIGFESGEQIEPELQELISKNWDETLLILYGSIQSSDYSKLLENAEQWLQEHAESAILNRVLGKLSIAAERPDKAELYLTKSLQVEPTVGAYQLLGELYFKRGDKDRASDCYKNGLELASSEVVSSVENMVVEE